MLSVGLYSYLQNYLSLFRRVRGQLPNEEVKEGEREKVEKKLPNEYKPLFIPKGI